MKEMAQEELAETKVEFGSLKGKTHHPSAAERPQR